jgi:hypothetical protein
MITQVRRYNDVATYREAVYGANDPGTVSAWSQYGDAANNAAISGCY